MKTIQNLMKKTLIIGGIVLLLLVGGFLAVKKIRTGNNANNVSSTSINTATNAPATIQILRGNAYLVDKNGNQIRELKNDEILVFPLSILVTKGGLANINFPDGSMVRVDEESIFTVNQGFYDPATGKSNVNITLSAGEIWSKVVELATPDSSWEVQTSNAVATVRGTAFNTFADDKKVIFTGAENNVGIVPINLGTHQLLEDQEIILTSDKEIEISNDQLKDLANHKQKLALREHKVDAKLDAWIKQNKNQDAKVDEAVQEIKRQMKDKLLNGGRLSPELRKELRLRIQERLLNFYIENQKELDLQDADISSLKAASIFSVIKPKILNTDNTSSRNVSFHLILISPDPVFDPVLEGTQIVAKAVLKFSDGTSEDVTDKAEWGVEGPVGNIVSPGIFIAKLDRSATDSVGNLGSMTVKFTNPTTKETYFLKTTTFKVVAGTQNKTSTNPLTR